MSHSTDFTRLLQQAKDGDEDARARAFELVYDELRQVARRVGSDRAGHTLQPTAVVHEAWFKLAPRLDGVKDRLHFFAVASLAMRQVLADHARKAKREKRGGGQRAITLDGDFAERGSSAVPSRPLKKSRREAKRAATRLGTRRRDGGSGLPGR